MTSTQRTASGLRFIARPKTTRIERIAFSVFRHWHWTGIVVSSMLTAGVMMLSITLAAGLHAEGPIRSGTIGFLLAILLLALPVWNITRIELGAAPAWMIRAALATTTDTERAFLFERLLQLATSEWRIDPISCGALFYLYREAKLNFGDLISQEGERLMSQREEQVAALKKVANATKL